MANHLSLGVDLPENCYKFTLAYGMVSAKDFWANDYYQTIY